MVFFQRRAALCVAQASAIGMLMDMIACPAVKSGWGMDYAWAHQLRYKHIGIIDWYHWCTCPLCAAKTAP